MTQLELPPADQQVHVGRGDVDGARLDGLAVNRLLHRQPRAAAQEGWQQAFVPGIEVLDDEHRHWQGRWQRGHDRMQGLHAAGRGADGDDIIGNALAGC
jgi:hypothetical protein